MIKTARKQIADEVKRREEHGARAVRSISALEDEFRAIGYRFDRSSDCLCQARYASGESYPCRSLYPVDIETGLSAFHIDHKRDKPRQLEALQKLRQEVFAVSCGYISEV